MPKIDQSRQNTNPVIMKHDSFKHLLQVTTGALFLLFSGDALCQTLFIKPIEGSAAVLTSAEQQRKTTIEQLPYTGQSALIEIGNLALDFSSGTVDVEFPMTECGTLHFRTVEAEYYSEANYTWYGEVTGDTTCTCRDGFLLLVSQGGQRFGHLSIGGEYYDIAEVSSGKHLLTKSDFSDFIGAECGTTGGGSSGATSAPPAHDRNSENCEIRVLALYNRSTVQAEGDVWAVRNRIGLAVAQTNIALKNSLVQNTRLVLAGIDSIPGFADSLPGSVQLHQFAYREIDTIAKSPVVRAMRDNVGADIVAFVTGDDYTTPNGNVFGFVGTQDLVDSLAYVLVETGHATTGRYTFAHEIAHVLSCRHDFNSDPTPGIMHGHRFDDAACRVRNTIMQSIKLGDSRILHYSNPRVRFAGRATGTFDREYNALQFQSNACTVASFRETNNQPLRANIKGDSEGCPCDAIVLTAEIYGGVPGNYSYEWRVSSDGVNYGPVVATTSTYAVNLPCVEDERIFVRLQVTGADGSTATRFASLKATYDLPSGLPCARNTHNLFGQVSSDLSIYPNPASNEVTLMTKTALAGTLFVFSPIGQIIFTTLSNSESVTIPVAGWPSGIYICRHIDRMGVSQTAKFIIKH